MPPSQRTASPKLSSRYAAAFRFALKSHGAQVRKGTTIPYVSHVMAVSSLVLDYGGSEDQAIAGLLHDTVEDCGVKYADLRRKFGAHVMLMVKECTDAETIPKPPWKERKLKYIDHLKIAHHDTLLVSAADKLHNSRAIVHDVKHHGVEVWKRFKASPAETLWYYQSLCAIFRQRAAEASADFPVLVEELANVVQELGRLAA